MNYQKSLQTVLKVAKKVLVRCMPTTEKQAAHVDDLRQAIETLHPQSNDAENAFMIAIEIDMPSDPNPNYKASHFQHLQKRLETDAKQAVEKTLIEFNKRENATIEVDTHNIYLDKRYQSEP